MRELCYTCGNCRLASTGFGDPSWLNDPTSCNNHKTYQFCQTKGDFIIDTEHQCCRKRPYLNRSRNGQKKTRKILLIKRKDLIKRKKIFTVHTVWCLARNCNTFSVIGLQNLFWSIKSVNEGKDSTGSSYLKPERGNRFRIHVYFPSWIRRDGFKL